MESQPQNPEFRNNPEKFYPCIRSFLAWGNFCHLLITFANILNPDQDWHSVSPDLVPNCLAGPRIAVTII